MGFRQSGLQEAFFVPGDHAFRAWGYGTTDPLEEVLRRGYFRSTTIRPGELLYVRAQEQPRAGRGEAGPVHMALLMMVGKEPNGACRLRLVQDFGRTDGPDAAPLAPSPVSSVTAAPKRRRGRPAGSRTREAAADDHAGPTGP